MNDEALRTVLEVAISRGYVVAGLNFYYGASRNIRTATILRAERAGLLLRTPGRVGAPFSRDPYATEMRPAWDCIDATHAALAAAPVE